MRDDVRSERVDGLGYLDTLGFRDGLLHAAGWVAPARAARVTALELGFAGRWHRPTLAELGLPSPDLAHLSHLVADVENARFHVAVPESELGPRADWTRLVCVRSSFERLDGPTDGPIVANVLEQDIPLPGPEDRELVHGVGGTTEEVTQEFAQIAFTTLALLMQRAGLEPGDRVLDVGCGMGRIAYALAHYLRDGSYEGLDVNQDLVEWAQQTIGTRYPNFRFTRIDAVNRYYNPAGELRTDAVALPFDDGRFDLVMLLSVFTHMRGAEVRRYLSEVHRVLAPGGRCVCTFFLMQDSARRRIAEDPKVFQIVHPFEDGWVRSVEVPENLIGFDEERVVDWIGHSGLVVQELRYGSWCGPREGASVQLGQDTFVLLKPRP